MDMAYTGWTTTLRAVQVGTPLFIAAENHTGGAEYLVCSFNIKKPEDLFGKKIATEGDSHYKSDGNGDLDRFLILSSLIMPMVFISFMDS